MRAASSLFLFSNQSPAFLHALDVGLGQTRSDVDPAVGDPLVDLQFGHGPAVDQHEDQSAASLNAERVEGNAAMLIELKERTVIPIGRGIGIEGDLVSLRQPRQSLD